MILIKGCERHEYYQVDIANLKNDFDSDVKTTVRYKLRMASKVF